jgi:hypothetical protein
MSITPASPNQPTPGPGLPPVAPPSGRFVVQLFLVPALIVILLVGVAWSFHFLFGLVFGSPSPDQYLKKLDDPNAEVRWRTAADLAQVLLRDDHLAADSDFALKLADRLDKAHERSKEPEKKFAERLPTLSADDAERERKKLEDERNYVQYLSASLGNFMVPVGVPVLQELATQSTGMEPKALALQRRQAVWALAILGEKCKQFDKLPPAEQDHIIARLDDAAERREHAEWAEAARDYLMGRQAGKPTTMGVDKTMETCAASPEPFVRELAAFALNFWSGTDEENRRIEKTLEALSNDKGEGEDEQAREAGEDPNSATVAVTKKPGRKVCYNATIALARRGSDKTRVDMLEEMLDEDQLRDLFVLRAKDGREQPDQDLVTNTEMNALKAVAEMHRRNPKLATQGLRDAVNKLTSDKNAAVAKEAQETKKALDLGN